MALRQCSRSTRATWMDLICLAQQGEPYGHLRDASGPLSIKFMANWCGVSTRQFLMSICELEAHQVFSRLEDGTIYSRRMVRDEKVRLSRASGGAKSLENPNVPKRKDILQGSPSVSEEGSPYPHTSKDVLNPVYVCVNDSSELPQIENQPHKATVAIDEGKPISNGFHRWFESWCQRTARRVREIPAAHTWQSVANEEDETAIWECSESYWNSAEVARGAVMNPDKWLFDAAQSKWTSRWPTATRESPRTKQQELMDEWRIEAQA